MSDIRNINLVEQRARENSDFETQKYYEELLTILKEINEKNSHKNGAISKELLDELGKFNKEFSGL